MTNKKKWLAIALGTAVVAAASGATVALARSRSSAAAAPVCRGPGMGMGQEDGHGNGHGADMMGIHFLFAHREEITRKVTEIPSGVRTLTETDNPSVTAQLQEHVQAMYDRLKEGRPIHARDPLSSSCSPCNSATPRDAIPDADREDGEGIAGHRDVDRSGGREAHSQALRSGEPVRGERHA